MKLFVLFYKRPFYKKNLEILLYDQNTHIDDIVHKTNLFLLPIHQPIYSYLVKYSYVQ